MHIGRKLIAAAAVVAIALAILSQASPHGYRPPAPNFTVHDAQGCRQTLDDFRGQVVLLNFWATWCGVCREEIPFLNRAQRQFAASGLAIVAVSLDEDGWDAVKSTVREQRIQYPVFLPDRITRRTYADVKAVPTLILIDRRGRIAARHAGYDEDRAYAEEIRKLLAEPAGAVRPPDHLRVSATPR